MREPSPIVKALIAERERLGLSQREVGRRAQLAAANIAHVEAGIHSPTLYTINAWAGALGFRLELVRDA